MDYASVVTVMRKLAIAGAAEIMDVYSSDSFDVRAKSDDSPVTEADIRADAVISEGLKTAFDGKTHR